jgi:hypothetical protein
MVPTVRGVAVDAHGKLFATADIRHPRIPELLPIVPQFDLEGAGQVCPSVV